MLRIIIIYNMVQLTDTTKYLAIKYYIVNEHITQEEVSEIFGINI